MQVTVQGLLERLWYLPDFRLQKLAGSWLPRVVAVQQQAVAALALHPLMPVPLDPVAMSSCSLVPLPVPRAVPSPCRAAPRLVATAAPSASASVLAAWAPAAACR